MLEALVGRCFNHSLGAAKLIELCLYDEALNLTRSIAEITNLMVLFDGRPEIFARWKTASRKERLNEFSPAKIREKLQKNGWSILPVSKEAYQELCEIATHVTPDTRPNRHDSDLEFHGLVGGVYEEIGHKKSTNMLLCYCALSCVVTCKIFGMLDRAEELGEIGANTFYDEPYKKSPPLHQAHTQE